MKDFENKFKKILEKLEKRISSGEKFQKKKRNRRKIGEVIGKKFEIIWKNVRDILRK